MKPIPQHRVVEQIVSILMIGRRLTGRGDARGPQAVIREALQPIDHGFAAGQVDSRFAAGPTQPVAGDLRIAIPSLAVDRMRTDHAARPLAGNDWRRQILCNAIRGH